MLLCFFAVFVTRHVPVLKVITVIKLRLCKGDRTENTNRHNSSKGGWWSPQRGGHHISNQPPVTQSSDLRWFDTNSQLDP